MGVTHVLGIVLDDRVIDVLVLVGFVLRLVDVLLKLVEVRCGERTKYLTSLQRAERENYMFESCARGLYHHMGIITLLAMINRWFSKKIVG